MFKMYFPHIMSGDLRCNDYVQGSGEMTQTCPLLNIVSERIKWEGEKCLKSVFKDESTRAM